MLVAAWARSSAALASDAASAAASCFGDCGECGESRRGVSAGEAAERPDNERANMDALRGPTADVVAAAGVF